MYGVHGVEGSNPFIPTIGLVLTGPFFYGMIFLGVKLMNKINYNLEMEKVLKTIDLNNKPSLLLHSCCGPCSSAVIERLAPFFKLQVLYYNPNIDTYQEYMKRAGEQIRFIKEFGLEDEVKVQVIDYDKDAFLEAVKGYEHYKEGSVRCVKCFNLRLSKTAELAKAGNFDYFTTTLSISPWKDSQVLNKLGNHLGEIYGVNYLYSDFKKKNGFKRSVDLSNKFNMYRQCYCGCEFSEEETLKSEKKIN